MHSAGPGLWLLVGLCLRSGLWLRVDTTIHRTINFKLQWCSISESLIRIYAHTDSALVGCMTTWMQNLQRLIIIIIDHSSQPCWAKHC